MQDENDWNALCKLIRSRSDRRFVLLSRGAPPGCLIAFRYSEMENTTVRCPKQYDKAAGSINEPAAFPVENGASSYALFRPQSVGGRSCTAATSRTVRPI